MMYNLKGIKGMIEGTLSALARIALIGRIFAVPLN